MTEKRPRKPHKPVSFGRGQERERLAEPLVVAEIQQTAALWEIDAQTTRQLVKKLVSELGPTELIADESFDASDNSGVALLEQAVELLGPKLAIELILGSDLRQLVRRMRVADELSFWLCPLYQLQ